MNNHLSSCNFHQFFFELKQYVASHYEMNSIKLTTFVTQLSRPTELLEYFIIIINWFRSLTDYVIIRKYDSLGC